MVVLLAACGSEQPPSGPPPAAPPAVASGPGSAGLSTEIHHGIDVVDARVPAPPPGSTTAQVEVTLADINGTGPDTLLAATSPAARTVAFTGNGHAVAGITIPAAAGSSTGPPNPDRILLSGLHHPLRAGQSITISLVFARAGHATLRVPVVSPVP